MTFEDDFMFFNMLNGTVKRLTLKSQNLEWPPPEHVQLYGFPFKRIRMSEIPDEERAQMTHVFRGAEYEPLNPPPALIDTKV